MRILKALSVLGLFLLSSPAYAIKFHESIKNWEIYSMKQGGKLVCYVLSYPVEANKNPQREAYIIVTKVAKNIYEFNGSVGENLVKNQASLDVGGVSVGLFTRENLVWTKNKESDKKLINLMISNSNLKLKWNSIRKKDNIDTYSLIGFSQALHTIDQICK